MENIKLSITIGPLSIDYEGSSDFAETALGDIIEQLLNQNIPNMDSGALATEAHEGASSAPIATTTVSTNLSTTDIAAKMGAKSGTDLVVAAATYLHHTRGLEEFRRADILSEMKRAKAFYRSSYGGNLTKSLETLVKSGRLQNPGHETYALPYAEIENTKRLLQ